MINAADISINDDLEAILVAKKEAEKRSRELSKIVERKQKMENRRLFLVGELIKSEHPSEFAKYITDPALNKKLTNKSDRELFGLQELSESERHERMKRNGSGMAGPTSKQEDMEASEDFTKN